MYQKAIWTGVVCLLACAQFGCVHDSVFDKPYQPLKVSVKPKVRQALPSFVPFEFIPNAKRDPFLSTEHRRTMQKPVAKAADKGPIVKPKRARPLTELERYGLDEYRLRAVVSGVARPFAMVVDPKGHTHIVRIGMRLGRDGTVTRILSSGLIISTFRRTGTNARRRTLRKLGISRGAQQKRQPGYLEVGGQKLKLDPNGGVQRK